MSITPPSGQVRAGVQTTLTVNAFPGAHYVLTSSGWTPFDNVTYNFTEVDYDNASIRDHTGGGGTYAVTFANPGDHTVSAFCTTTDGQTISAQSVTVHVVAAVPPAFTIQAPAAGAAVALGESGANITVQLSVPSGPTSHVTVTADGNSITGTTNNGSFQTSVHLGPMPLGARTISVNVADNDGINSTKTVTVTGQDVAPPHLVIAAPLPESQAIADGTGTVVVPVNGTASDSQSGMIGGAAGVAWALSPTGTRTAAQAVSGTNFGSWQANVPISGFGAHTIFVWATDNAGNTTPAPTPVTVEVISSFVPSTLDERLSEREYLAGLMAFAHDQITVPGGTLDSPTLLAVLGQPLDRLSQPLSAVADRGGQEINQLRVPVELLRARIAATHAGSGPGTAGEADYRATAYAALLAAAGTSYAELRLARGAAPDVRQALAARLGIRLSPTSPDELDRLILDGTALSEAALETLFGLPDTTAADVLRIPPTPLLLTWRQAALVQTWADQDQHPNPPRAFAAVVDPDVIGTADVAGTPNSDPVRTLLTQRAQQLADYSTMLDGIRTATANPAQALANMQAQALPGVDLAALESQDDQGTDIAPALATAGLTRTGFTYLRKLAALAAVGSLTAAEWSDAVAVLTGAHKQTLYPAWRAQESGLVLSPDFFVLADDSGPQVSPLRVDPQARTDWRSVLRSRIVTRQEVIDAVAQAVADAEQAALPVLRDALLADLAPGITGDAGEEMSALFLVDMLAGGTLRTNRIGQAIESVQSLLSALRSGELPGNHPAAAWHPTDLAVFTAAWAWMGEFGSWQAATTAFLFPERQLDPTLLTPVANPTTGQPAPLATLLDAVRGTGDFSAATANGLAASYLGSFSQSFTYIDPHRAPSHLAALQRASSSTTDVAKNREMFWAVPTLLAQRLQAAGDFRAALDWYWLVYPYDLAQPNTQSIYSVIVAERALQPNLTFPPNWTAGLDPFALIANRPFPYTRNTLLSIVRCHLDYADSEYTRETDESVANARLLYLTALRLLGSPALVAQQPSNQGEPALPVPEVDTLRTRAEVQLSKLRQGRNIAGMPRSQGLGTGVTISQPTPFRFRVLMDRAKQLVASAAQMEAGYLAALEKYDDHNLRLFDALKGIDLNAAQVSLAGSRVKEANDAVTAAQAQQTKADVAAATYADLIAAPPNKYETDLLNEYGQMRDARNDIVEQDMAVSVMQAAANASSIWGEITSFGAAGALDIGIAGAAVLKARSEEQQNNLEAQMQANQLQAGIEQRRQDWRVQQISAQQESLVAAAQVATAQDQVTIAVQEQAIASLQYDQAVATLKFLNGQFTNADLYLWMSNTLGGVYRYFLQQATAISRLAQAQLAFERAQPPQNLIRNDYWQSPAELTANGSSTNRRGLTGAEQLAQDLTRLDEYALSSERRRLNLAQTFSLARLMPVEFLDFRRTGNLAFATPMSLFDNDFPGHYLRMVRQVRTSLVALVPVDRGIRATLYSNGVSRVTTGRDGTFTDIVVRHDPTVVALTSPVNATGVFELDVQSDLLLPFESSGVDTTWELQLPPAANPFDYSSIVDVLVTIEYTALYDANYRDQLVSRLNADRDRSADCVFSLSRDFPDQWYDLNNPADPAHRSVTIPLRDVDFPLGIEHLSTAAVAVRLVSDEPVPDTVVTLTKSGTGGDATATGGIASTRRGNATAWLGTVGRTPTGDWQLSLGSDVDPLFKSGQLNDILLVISWTGQAPAWT
ncbi:MAG: hypothetical protein J2P15_06265 [Micromonosporaceae bacterium]|nr:hypothetical protein [Micromonosporaceae bacterium]